MIMNQTPYPISFEQQMSQALVCRYGEEMRQYVFKPDIDVSGLSCLLQIAKTDGTFTENGVEVHTDPDTGECTLVITIPQQATVVKGLNRYSICVYGPIEGEDHLLYSAEGPLWVDDNLITDDMIASVAEVNGLVFPRDFLTVENLVDIVNYVAAEILKDDVTSETTTWSSQKISDEIDGHTSPMALDDLTDVVLTSPQEGDIIRMNNSGQWVNIPIPGYEYSQTEQIVGKWTDGKPIYQITLVISSFNATNLDNNWYYGTVDLSTYGINPEHVFPDCAASYITLADTTTRIPVYIDWQGGSNVYPYFIGSRTGTLTLTLRYTKQ